MVENMTATLDAGAGSGTGANNSTQDVSQPQPSPSKRDGRLTDYDIFSFAEIDAYIQDNHQLFSFNDSDLDNVPDFNNLPNISDCLDEQFRRQSESPNDQALSFDNTTGLQQRGSPSTVSGPAVDVISNSQEDPISGSTELIENHFTSIFGSGAHKPNIATAKCVQPVTDSDSQGNNEVHSNSTLSSLLLTQPVFNQTPQLTHASDTNENRHSRKDPDASPKGFRCLLPLGNMNEDDKELKGKGKSQSPLKRTENSPTHPTASENEDGEVSMQNADARDHGMDVQMEDAEASDYRDDRDYTGYEDDSNNTTRAKAFERDPTASPAPTQLSDSFIERPWKLRDGARKHVKGVGAWVDQDTSGDYDPNSKEGPHLPSKVRTIGVPRRGAANDIHPRKRTRTMEAMRRSGNRFCISLQIGTQKAAEFSQEHSDNWPDDAVVNNLEDADYAADESSSDSGTYNLRHRCKASATFGPDEEEDLTGRPEGRGCRKCQVANLVCSMLEPGGGYPCDICLEEDDDCEPLVEPAKKQPCENCRRSHRSCSYAYPGSDHRCPCTHCADKGWKCIAGPIYDPTRARMDAEGNPVVPEDRGPRYNTGRYRSCAQCRRSDKQCPLLRTKDDPPCLHCKNEGKTCTFEALRKQPLLSNPHPPNSNKSTVNDAVPITTEDTTDATTASTKHQLTRHTPAKSGTIKEITTALSHPITFNSPPGDPDKLCNWCTDPNPFYALYGHLSGRRTVRILEWSDKRACTELRNGFTQPPDKHLPSRMCALCTFTRVKILFCRRHQFRRIPDVDPTAIDIQNRQQRPRAALTRLVGVAKAAEKLDCHNRSVLRRQELSKWCAVCPNPATHECCAGGSREQLGCGLRLCHVCCMLVSGPKTYAGDFVRFVKEVGGKVERSSDVAKFFPQGLRADYGFFAWEGFMMRQVRAAQLERLGKR